jgi:hypothetical protein
LPASAIGFLYLFTKERKPESQRRCNSAWHLQKYKTYSMAYVEDPDDCDRPLTAATKYAAPVALLLRTNSGKSLL